MSVFDAGRLSLIDYLVNGCDKFINLLIDK
jgi:hypothetical protein